MVEAAGPVFVVDYIWQSTTAPLYRYAAVVSLHLGTAAVDMQGKRENGSRQDWHVIK